MNAERRWIESEAQVKETRSQRRRAPQGVVPWSNGNGSETTEPFLNEAADLHGGGAATLKETVDHGRGGGPASIGATETSIGGLADEDDDEDDAGGWTDLFSDPDPIDTFHFRFEVPRHHPQHDRDDSRSNVPDESMRHIDIELTGYKMELGQTLHSTGLTLWRASSLLCDFLLQHPVHIRDKSVLELGAGLGLCGILASHLRASKVVLTDGDTDALQYLRSNVERNAPRLPRSGHEGGAGTPISGSLAEAVIVRQLIWGEPAQLSTNDNDRFDTVLGSDIIYIEEILEPLWRTVDAVLAPHGAFLLAFARRNVPIDRVFETAAGHGFVGTHDDSIGEGVVLFRRAASLQDTPLLAASNAHQSP